jgi:hypothetical protein
MPNNMLGLGFGVGRRRVAASALLGWQQAVGMRGFGRLGALHRTFLFQGLSGFLGHRLPGRFIRHRGPLVRGPVLVPVVPVYAPSACRPPADPVCDAVEPRR